MADANGISVAPIRSLDDFLLDKARFQNPNFKDIEKWSNRVIQNLLYYQTNYFLTYFVVFSIVSILHPMKMFCGSLAVGLAFLLFYYITNDKRPIREWKKNHPFVSIIVVLFLGYCVVYFLGSVFVFLFGILLPICVVFIHASMRLRNLKNKLINKMEWAGLKKSPMGAFLDTMGMEQDFTM